MPVWQDVSLSFASSVMTKFLFLLVGHLYVDVFHRLFEVPLVS